MLCVTFEVTSCNFTVGSKQVEIDPCTVHGGSWWLMTDEWRLMDPVTRSGGPVGAPAWLHRMRVMWSQRQRVMGAQLCKRAATRESDWTAVFRFASLGVCGCFSLITALTCFGNMATHSKSWHRFHWYSYSKCSVLLCFESVVARWVLGEACPSFLRDIFWLLLQFPLEHLLEYVWLLLC